MSLHTEFRLPDGTRLVNQERGLYTPVPDGFFGTEQPRVEVMTELVEGAVVPTYRRAPTGVLMSLAAIGRPDDWIRTEAAVAIVPCPNCSVLPGVPCVGRQGWSAMPHHVRCKAYRAIRRGDAGQAIEAGQVWTERWGPGRSIRVLEVRGVEVQVEHVEHPRKEVLVTTMVRDRYRLGELAPAAAS